MTLKLPRYTIHIGRKIHPGTRAFFVYLRVGPKYVFGIEDRKKTRELHGSTITRSDGLNIAATDVSIKDIVIDKEVFESIP